MNEIFSHHRALSDYSGTHLSVKAHDGRRVSLHAALPKTEIETEGDVSF